MVPLHKSLFCFKDFSRKFVYFLEENNIYETLNFASFFTGFFHFNPLTTTPPTFPVFDQQKADAAAPTQAAAAPGAVPQKRRNQRVHSGAGGE